MVFEVPASKASIDQNRFKFKLPGQKKTWSVPKLQFISSDLRLRMQEASIPLKRIIDEGGQPAPEQTLEVQAIQRELFETYAPGLYKQLTDDQIPALMQAWQEASGISLGESSPSAD
jgi:hypothetical protein